MQKGWLIGIYSIEDSRQLGFLPEVVFVCLPLCLGLQHAAGKNNFMLPLQCSANSN